MVNYLEEQLRKSSESKVSHKQRGQRLNATLHLPADTESKSYTTSAEWTAKMTNRQKGRPTPIRPQQRMTIDLEEETVTSNPAEANMLDNQAISRLLNMGYLPIQRSIIDLDEEMEMHTPGAIMPAEHFVEGASDWSNTLRNGITTQLQVEDNVRGYVATLPERSVPETFERYGFAVVYNRSGPQIVAVLI